MIRRQFLNSLSSVAIAGIGFNNSMPFNLNTYQDIIIGHNDFRYKVDMHWGKLDNQKFPVNDCHEMVQDSKGRILLLTNHTKNNIIVYDRSGQLIEVWGTEFPGAHGLTLNIENGKDFLYIADNRRNEVIKTTIEGQIIQIFKCPLDSEFYVDAKDFVPTETAVASNGDVYIADGYGRQFIVHYNAQGDLLNIFGGKGENDNQFNNAHGICIDKRNGKESLLITARMQNKLKRFSLDGHLLEIIDLPGAFICRPVIKGNHIYLATIWSGQGEPNSGFISILDKENKMISAPGGNTPTYKNGRLQPMYQTLKIFKHPHDVCVDDEGSLYVAQWNAGQSYPIKLIRV